MILKPFSILVLVCILKVSNLSAHNILFLAPFPAPSHWMFIKHFVDELLVRGHSVTAITNFKAKDNHSNYTEVVIDPSFDIPYYFPINDIFEMRYSSDLENLFLYWRVGLLTSQHALENDAVQRFINRKDLKFDLIVSEQFFQESFLMFVHKFNCPFVTIGSLEYSDFMDRNMGLITPLAFVPHMILNFSDNMSFYERFYNLIISLADALIRKFHYLPKQNELALKHFNSTSAELPYIGDLEKQVSAMFINAHPSTRTPRPLMPGQIDVAGAHIRKPNPLDVKLKAFLDEAEHGVIVFSLGSYIQSKDMPDHKLQAFLNVFRGLKQKVLWKYEADAIVNLPNNVRIEKWLPQSDVLCHENVVLFITHGGIFGTIEGLHHGKKMLLIPFFGDQFENALKAQKSGYGLILPFKDLNEKSLRESLNEILSNDSMTEQAKISSLLFRDNPIEPMAEAMFWIEYVIRNKGAKHLKSAAVYLPWYQYMMLDVVALIFVLLIAAYIILYSTIKYIVLYIFFLMKVFRKVKTQ